VTRQPAKRSSHSACSLPVLFVRCRPNVAQASFPFWNITWVSASSSCRTGSSAYQVRGPRTSLTIVFSQSRRRSSGGPSCPSPILLSGPFSPHPSYLSPHPFRLLIHPSSPASWSVQARLQTHWTVAKYYASNSSERTFCWSGPSNRSQVQTEAECTRTNGQAGEGRGLFLVSSKHPTLTSQFWDILILLDILVHHFNTKYTTISTYTQIAI
jgi:hypothetical protein